MIQREKTLRRGMGQISFRKKRPIRPYPESLALILRQFEILLQKIHCTSPAKVGNKPRHENLSMHYNIRITPIY